MSHRSSTPWSFAAAILIAGAATLTGARLQAQEEVAAPAVTLPTTEPAAGLPAAPAASSMAGPRVTPPLERYEPALPGRSESAAPVARGGSHTIVISTLVLVLAVIIIVLLAVN